MTEDQRLHDYLERLRAEVIDTAIQEVEGADQVAATTFREQAYTEVLLAFLEDHGQVSDPSLCYVDKYFGRGIGKLNAWHCDTDNGIATLVTTIFRGMSEPRSITATELTQAVERALRAYRSALSGAHLEMEPATCSFDAFEYLYSNRGALDRVRVIVLGDGFAADLGNTVFDVDAADVAVDVWDTRRCFRLHASGLPYEPIEIDVTKRLGRPLSCIALQRSDARDFEVYMTMLPGNLLHALYHEYGPRILELNVRSFLQARGKVNRGIRETLKNEPENFVAYNNGISATAESIEVTTSEGCPAIAKLRGLQVVNGGQTVASIHRAKERDRHDLSHVFVQAKITRVSPEQIDILVPQISRFANTQNAVREADFSANHPFHVRLQQLSETVWTPGEQSRWFYERARGQYEVALQREGTTPARRQRFRQTNPKGQTFDKVKLAKYVNVWDQLPHVVSRGGQKNFAVFMQRLYRNRPESWEPDVPYFKETIAKAIIFKQAESAARRHGFPGYRANAVAYTAALVSYRTAGRIDLGSVWERQAVSRAVKDTINTWMPAIYHELIESSGGRNVTEWCKKEECWRHLQTLSLVLPSELREELAAGQPLPTVGSMAGKTGEDLSEDDRENIARVMQVPADVWVHVVGWGSKTGQLQQWQQGIATTLAAYAAAEWSRVPSRKQALQGARILRVAEENGGMPWSD